MHAVLRKRLAMTPTALSVGRADGVGRVRDIVAVLATELFSRSGEGVVRGGAVNY